MKYQFCNFESTSIEKKKPYNLEWVIEFDESIYF